MAKQNFVFTNLLVNRIKPHELREVLNRWGLALRTSKDNQQLLRDRIIECRDMMPSETVAFNNLLDDLDEHIEFWDANPLYKTRRSHEAKSMPDIKPVTKTKIEPVKAMSLREFQLEYVLWVLHRNNFNLSHTAESLKISIRTVRNTLRGAFGNTPVKSIRKSVIDFHTFDAIAEFAPVQLVGNLESNPQQILS